METVVPVEACGLVKRFATRGGTPLVALDEVSLRIPAGRLSALVGPDGAGKTTLLRLIAGLMKADGGQLRVLGLDVGAEPQAVQDRISYMPQKFGLYEDLTIQENLDLYADLHGVEPGQRKERFARLLEMTDLSRFTGRLAGQLSGGMKQKLGLACTLVRSPDLLLLDEPTVGVDPLSRRELWQIIEQLIEQERLSVLISTAYMNEAQRCAQVFVLYQGNLIAEGTPEDLSERAKDLCYGIEPAAGVPARTLQARLIDDREHIVDAVPYGGQVRFIRSGHASLEEIPSLHGEQAAQPLAARLEDGFMVLLREHASDQGQPSPQAPADEPGGEEELESERRPIIEVRDLVRKFGDFTAVASTSFKVFKGEIFGLLGPNGAGKTTTFRMLCGLLPASSGHLEVAGVNLRSARAAARRRIGYVSQKFSLYGNLSVQENLEFFGGAYGLFGGGDSRHGSIPSCASSSCRGSAMIAAGTCRAATSSAWPWRWPCSTSRTSSSSTSLPAASTRWRAAPSGGRSPNWPRRGPPSSSPRTSWRKRSTATGSSSRMPGACWRWERRKRSGDREASRLPTWTVPSSPWSSARAPDWAWRRARRNDACTIRLAVSGGASSP